MDFGEFLRLNRKISLYELSKMTGISRQQLSNYEQSKSEITIHNAKLICKAIGKDFLIVGK
jgi:transcriptional regulator with XRE-family HTH domain